MTTKVVREEVSRFLNSSEPEVLCVTGKWGVGKTFGWDHYLKEAECEFSRKAEQVYGVLIT